MKLFTVCIKIGKYSAGVITVCSCSFLFSYNYCNSTFLFKWDNVSTNFPLHPSPAIWVLWDANYGKERSHCLGKQVRPVIQQLLQDDLARLLWYKLSLSVNTCSEAYAVQFKHTGIEVWDTLILARSFKSVRVVNSESLVSLKHRYSSITR